MNHGQAYTERGFSINQKVSDTNMEDDFLIAQSLIYDVIKKTGEVVDFPITKELRGTCKKAYSNIILDTEKKKAEAEKNDKELKRKGMRKEIANLKKRKVEMENAIVTLTESLAKEAMLLVLVETKSEDMPLKPPLLSKTWWKKKEH